MSGKNGLFLRITIAGIFIAISGYAKDPRLFRVDDFISTPAPGWKFQTSGQFFATPLVLGNYLLAGSTDSTLYAVDLYTGKLLWKFRTDGQIRNTPCQFGESVIFFSGDGNLYSLETLTGKLLWKFFAGQDHMYDVADCFQSSAVISLNTVYFGSGDGKVYAVDAGSGKPKWNFQTGNLVHSSPALGDGKVFAGSFDGYVYALDTTDGRLLWKFKTVGHSEFPKGEVQGAPVFIRGKVFVSARDNNLYALDADSGYCHWNSSFPESWALALSPSDHDTVLYAGTVGDPAFLMFNTDSGKEAWDCRLEAGNPARCAETPGLCYITLLNGDLIAIRRHDGSIAWKYPTGKNAGKKPGKPERKNNPDGNSPDTFAGSRRSIRTQYSTGLLFSKPVLIHDRIILSSSDGSLYCLLRTAPEKPESEFPVNPKTDVKRVIGR